MGWKGKETVEITVEVKRETILAKLVTDGGAEVWIPKSQIVSETVLPEGLVEMVIPEWLAIAKELI